MDEIVGSNSASATYTMAGFGSGLIFALLVYLFFKNRIKNQCQTEIDKATNEASAILANAEVDAKNSSNEIIDQARQKAREIELSLLDYEKRLSKESAILEAEKISNKKEIKSLEDKKDSLLELEKYLTTLVEKNSETESNLRKQLEDISGLDFKEARSKLLSDAEESAELESQQISKRIVEKAKLDAESEAKKIIASAIYRYAGEFTYDSTTSTVNLPSGEIKGRIIGREGRNIRAFEMATGVTVLIDDTRNAVVISGFDPVRREIAKNAMERLIEDGRIHPTRIEEVAENSREDIEQAITTAGFEAQQKIQIPMLNQDVTHVLGKLKFRLSYSQNILDHSIEVARICGLLASELGCDEKVAKQCGLLHDIGKAINHENEGGHASVGADFLKKNGLPDEVVNGVASHHLEVESEGPYGILVGAADAISAARPGARSESLNTYLNRIEELEKLADSFPGIKKSFAVHAGREVRVLVNADEVDDMEAYKLARSLARSIEDKLQYPGQIRVTVIRETRCVEFAK